MYDLLCEGGIGHLSCGIDLTRDLNIAAPDAITRMVVSAVQRPIQPDLAEDVRDNLNLHQNVIMIQWGNVRITSMNLG